MKPSQEQLNELLKGNHSLRRANPDINGVPVSAIVPIRDPRPVAIVERSPGNAALGKSKGKKAMGARVLVRVTSYRRRLLDEDGLCEKYVVDLLRYSGALEGDEPGKAKIEVCQFKVAKGEEEKTIVEIFQPRAVTETR